MSSRDPFAPLPKHSNKYSRGKLVLIVGSSSYTGAAALAACASERMGAGYTEVVTTPEAIDVVRRASYSLVVRPRDSWSVAALAAHTSEHPLAVGIGSGFEGNDNERAITISVLQQAQCSVLVDGKALDYLGCETVRAILKMRKDKGLATVLTPHGGEAARLVQAVGIALDGDNSSVDAQKLATAYDSIVVLKGPDTYISDGTTTVAMTEGTPALAKAGTGDVLAGMISALLAQGVDPLQASLIGTTIHARAGREAACSLTETAVIAQDVIDYIPVAIAKR